MSLNYSFAGKKVLITGGGQGIGKRLVEKFHEGGAVVFTLDKDIEKITHLREQYPEVRAEIIDLRDWEGTRKLIESFGEIDHLVNNAGVLVPTKFLDVTKEMAGLHFEVNVGAAINVTQVFAKGIIQSGREGSVVNIASIAARRGGPIGGMLYSCTKACLENLTKSMALELGPYNIRVNCVLPGAVDAPMLFTMGKKSSQMDERWDRLSIQERFKERSVVKKIVDPGEIVDLVMFLLSPLAQMIVGEGVVIDGGMLIK